MELPQMQAPRCENLAGVPYHGNEGRSRKVTLRAIDERRGGGAQPRKTLLFLVFRSLKTPILSPFFNFFYSNTMTTKILDWQAIYITLHRAYQHFSILFNSIFPNSVQ